MKLITKIYKFFVRNIKDLKVMIQLIYELPNIIDKVIDEK